MTKKRSKGFKPISDLGAEVLILGSLPGPESLEKKLYYAYGRNSFWRIMGNLLNFDPESSYETRSGALRRAGIALWDVLQSGERAGGLDGNIKLASVRINDFRSFLHKHSRVKAVFFNGSKAESLYMRHVLATVQDLDIRYTRLPSTSPAHAVLSFEKKLEAWRVVLPRH